MSLHLVIGFDGPSNEAAPTLVYAGHSGGEAEKARVASKCYRFLIQKNPLGVRKANPNHPRALKEREAREKASAAENEAIQKRAEHERRYNGDPVYRAQCDLDTAKANAAAKAKADAPPADDSIKKKK